ncbi:MAG: CAP domain-containing protein [Actinomycetota bacterium]
MLIGSSLAFAPSASAARPLRSKMLHQLNEIRERKGRRPVTIDRRLSKKARRHTRAMIRRNDMFHTAGLSRYMARRSLTPWGENLGCGGSVRRVLRALMRSAAHRANILKRSYRRIGLGVVTAWKGNMCGKRAVWTTQIFYSR